jgi:hypothetical protein
MVAVTGFYDSLGSSEEGRYPNAEALSTPDVIVQGTTYVEKAPGVEDKGLKAAEQYITANAAAIDAFLAAILVQPPEHAIMDDGLAGAHDSNPCAAHVWRR